MPNWCNNYIEVSHEDPSKIRALADALNRGEFCSHVIPTPRELTETVAGSVGEDKKAEHEAQVASNLEKFGHSDWYSFQTTTWGTKWDVGGDSQADVSDDGLTMSASFDSAWSPPTGVYEALVDQGFEVRAYYYESGMAYCGVFDNGSDDYWEIGDMSADEVEATIPSDLDECMCITEGIREYQAMNEEDEELYNWVKDGSEKLGLVTE